MLVIKLDARYLRIRFLDFNLFFTESVTYIHLHDKIDTLSLPLLYTLDVSHSTGGNVNVILSDRLFFE